MGISYISILDCTRFLLINAIYLKKSNTACGEIIYQNKKQLIRENWD